MRATTLSAIALLVVSGCASAPPAPAQTAPTFTGSSPTPDWAASAIQQQEQDFAMVPVASPKAKAAATDEAAPATGLKVDRACAQDVKSAHLKAADANARQSTLADGLR